jgi:hypothetical protein
MKITINLPPDLEQDLLRQAEQSHVPLQTLILRALRQTIQPPSVFTSQWSESILSYEGSPDFPAFESYRDELLPPYEPELSLFYQSERVTVRKDS